MLSLEKVRFLYNEFLLKRVSIAEVALKEDDGHDSVDDLRALFAAHAPLFQGA